VGFYRELDEIALQAVTRAKSLADSNSGELDVMTDRRSVEFGDQRPSGSAPIDDVHEDGANTLGLRDSSDSSPERPRAPGRD